MHLTPRHAFAALAWSLPLLAGLGLAYALTGLVGQGGAPARTPAAQAGPMQVAAPAGPDQVLYQRNIMRLDLPRDMRKEEIKAEPPLTDPLRWMVVGIFLRDTGAVAIVKIEAETHIVYLGKTLHDWLFAEAFADRTVWTRDGETRELNLNMLPQFMVQEKERDKDGGVKRKAGTSVQFSEKYQLDKKAAQEIIKDPVKLLEQALYKPVKQGDDVIGFSIRNIKEDSVLRKIGIKDDDILVRLNGREVKNPVALLQAYSGLERARSVAVDVIRDGYVKSILLELK